MAEQLGLYLSNAWLSNLASFVAWHATVLGQRCIVESAIPHGDRWGTGTAGWLLLLAESIHRTKAGLF